MHWYLTEEATGDVTYHVPITLCPDTYTFEASAQGMSGDKVSLSILDAGGAELFAGEAAVMNGWVNWQTPKVDFELTEETAIQLRIRVDMQKGGWGTVECLRLYSR